MPIAFSVSIFEIKKLVRYFLNTKKMDLVMQNINYNDKMLNQFGFRNLSFKNQATLKTIAIIVLPELLFNNGSLLFFSSTIHSFS